MEFAHITNTEKHIIFDKYPYKNFDGNTISNGINEFLILLQRENVKQLINYYFTIDIYDRYIKLLNTYNDITKFIATEIPNLDNIFNITNYLNSFELGNIENAHILLQRINVSQYTNFFEYSVRNILQYYNEFFYPLGVSEQNNTNGHAMAIYYFKLSDTEYNFHFFNSGDGAEYSKTTTDFQNVYGLLCFKINKDTLFEILKYILMFNKKIF